MSEVTHLWRVIQEWLDAQRFPPSQSRLGESLGVTRSTISDWKLGNAKPTPDHLRRLADLIEPALGPTTYPRLLAALVADMGYWPEDAKAQTGTISYLNVAGKDAGEVDVYMSREAERALREAEADDNEDLSDPDDEIPAAAKEGMIEEPGEFNT